MDINKDLEKAKKKDFMRLMLPEITEEKMDAMTRTAAPLAFPDIGGGPQQGQQAMPQPGPQTGPQPGQTPMPTPDPMPQPPKPPMPGMGQPQKPAIPKEKGMSKKEMEETLESLQHAMISLDLAAKLNALKHEIIDEVAQELKIYKNELDEYMNKKTPQRKFFDTGGAYKENLYTMATQLLDEIIPYLFESIPDYSLISTQISSTYEDGTVENALIAIRITIDYQTYKYDFKVDVPVLNGIIQSPLYLQRGIKIVPLTQEAIDTELSTISFRKTDPDKQYERKNLFNNVGDNPLRRKDNQKHYEVSQNKANPVGVPPKSMWNNSRGV